MARKNKKHTLQGEKEDIRLLFRSFKENKLSLYKDLIKECKKKYPTITHPNRRTGKELENICFFIWYFAKEEDNITIKLLLKSSILVFAQDDLYDDVKVTNQKKEEFYKECNQIIRGNKFKINNKKKQFIELINLWKEITKEAKKSPPHIYHYWQEKSDQMNEAMLTESYLLRNRNISFTEYMEISIHSIGIMFIWANYLAKKNISNLTLKEIDKSFLVGARITRLSNDVAGYRSKENKTNSVNVVHDKKLPLKYILNLISREKSKFDKSLLKVKVKNQIKDAIRKSVDFSIAFYTKRSS